MAELTLLDARYDAAGDVLYVGHAGEAASRAVEDEAGIVWRYAKGGEIIGATVLDYDEAWRHRGGDLATMLAKRLGRPVREMAALIERVAA